MYGFIFWAREVRKPNSKMKKDWIRTSSSFREELVVRKTGESTEELPTALYTVQLQSSFPHRGLLGKARCHQ